MTFKHTKDGMLYVPGELNEFVLAKEIKEEIWSRIRSATNMIEYHKDKEDNFAKEQVYTYEQIIETLKSLQEML